MAKFNIKSTGTKTENLAGGEAFQETPKTEFVSILLTSFVQNQYYRSEKDGLKRIQELLNSVDPKFAAKTAIFARNEFGMRSITHVAAAEIAYRVKGQAWTKDFYKAVVHRVDDITEILSYYLNVYGKPIPNSLKKGLASSFEKFDAYQIAKYRAEGQKVSLVDAANLVHPMHNETLEKLVKGELKSTETWEAKLTATQGDEKKKEEAWKSLILERKIGYFALLRNLRNIHNQSPEIIDKALELLADEKLIRKSLVLPFRYLTAVEEIEKLSGANKIIGSISRAVDIACSNVPLFSGRTLVVCDYSGSMDEGYKSYKYKGSLFGAILAKSNDADFMIFGDEAAYLSFNPADSALSITRSFCANNGGGGKGVQVGHGTNFHSIFETANKKYDRIIIFSDMQGWMYGGQPSRSFTAYKRNYDADPFIYSFDLAGYGTLQFPERNVFCIAGFSEKIFDIMKILEEDKNALINKIEAISFK